MDDAGASLLVFFNNPTINEIEQFRANSSFDMCLTNFSDVMLFTFKFGSLNWMDAPYNPHLSNNLTVLQDIPDDMGYAMTVVLIDSITGIIKNIRFISLSTGISKKIKQSAETLLTKPFDKTKYYISINNLFEKYNTKQLVKMADTYYKF